MPNPKRVAIVDGLRTPFCRQSTAYRTLSALDLGKMVTKELVLRSELDPEDIDQVVFGQVVPSLSAPNIAREIVLGTGLPPKIEAFSVSRACATSMQSIASGAGAIMTGHADVVIAGGADSASDVPVSVSKSLASALIDLSKARSLKQRMTILSRLRPKDLVPVPPALKEPSTGLTMGESAEKMAQENGITREAQDEVAHRSHERAAAAWESGKLDDEVMHVYVPPDHEATTRDNNVRTDSELASYARLRPVFDRKYGTITAANSSPLTDGAAAVVLMSEDKAKKLGKPVLGYLRSWAFAALDPKGQMLMGPSIASPMALERAGCTLGDMALIDMHEAFAAQVLSNTQAMERDIGRIDWDRFNVLGGSIAMGHPFAATAARQVTQTLRELKRRGGGELGLVTLCAAGGLGAAAVVEVAS